MGRQVAEWMATGEPSYDLAEADANRFYPFQTTPPYVLARGDAAVPRGLRHPASAPADDGAARPAAHAVPRAARGRSARSSSPARAGSGRSGSSANDAAGAATTRRGRDARRVGRARTGRRRWAPSTSRRASASALFDITPFAKFDVAGADALAFLERVCANRIDRPVGSVDLHGDADAARRHPLRPDGRRARTRTLFRVVTGGGCGHARPRVAARPAPRRRARHDHRAHRLALRARPVGAARARRPRGRHATPTSRTRRSRT